MSRVIAYVSHTNKSIPSAIVIISIDIIKRLRPATADRTLVLIGRVSACVVMVLAMAWSTQGERFGGIFAGINQMISCLAPPITTVFLWGVFWKRGTAQAAIVTLIGGFPGRKLPISITRGSLESILRPFRG